MTLDVSNPAEMMQMFSQCDEQIFVGFHDEPGLRDASVMETILQASRVCREIMQNPGGRVILSGCGTSGRVAFITSRSLNRHMVNCGKMPIFSYTIAGGDKALFTSVEAPEDDPKHGRDHLIQASADCDKVLFIGITCGLSAPYVAGQLEYCMRNPLRFKAVLIGFNPIHLARTTVMPSTTKTFRDVAMEMKKHENCLIITPVVGVSTDYRECVAFPGIRNSLVAWRGYARLFPEALTGSSRMKGGSTTKIILEMIFLLAESGTVHKQAYSELLDSYHGVWKEFYTFAKDDLTEPIGLAGDSLLKGGTVTYLGSDTCAIISMVDASECQPTFGSDLGVFRGFITGGYEVLQNSEGDISHLGPEHFISVDDFVKTRLSRLTQQDLIILLNPDECSGEIKPKLQQSDARMLPFHFQPNKSSGFVAKLQSELRAKWLCNCISTGAHVLAGKVFRNIMIDVRISNIKLYHRAVSIICTLTGSKPETVENLLRVYVLQGEGSIHDVISVANGMNLVVPHIVLSLLAGCNLEEATVHLNNEPVVRRIIQHFYRAASST